MGVRRQPLPVNDRDECVARSLTVSWHFVCIDRDRMQYDCPGVVVFIPLGRSSRSSRKSARCCSSRHSRAGTEASRTPISEGDTERSLNWPNQTEAGAGNVNDCES